MFYRYLVLLSFFSLSIECQECTKKYLPLSDAEGGSISLVAGCVNVVTGDYMETSRDLVVLGPEPLVWERFYSSSDYETSVFFDGWRHNFDSGVQFSCNACTTPYFVDFSGSTTRFKHQETISKYKGSYLPVPNYEGYTNIGTGVISGSLNSKNIKLECDFDKNRILASCGNGDQRIYTAQSLTYFPIIIEKKANRNRLEYQYQGSMLTRVIATGQNRDNIFGWIELYDSPKMKKSGGTFELIASDGRKVFYEIEKFKKKESKNIPSTYRISKVSGDELPTVSYAYSKKDCVYDFQIARKTLPNNRFLAINYYKHTKNPKDDFKIDRVSELRGPAGLNQEEVLLYSFDYTHKNDCSGITTVKDALGYIKKYYYNKDKRVDLIEKFCGSSTPSSKTKFFWNNEGELLSKQLIDDKENVLVSRIYEYDARGNIIKDVIHGNIRGNSPPISYVKSNNHYPDHNNVNFWRVLYKYSDDGFNLLLEEKEQNGKTTRYGYIPGTNLLAWKFIYENEVLCIRHFYKYDENAVLTVEITDDGSGIEENDLKNVNQRKIRRIKLQNIHPIGLPKEEDELYLDLSTGKECLLRRVVNEFSSSGRLLSQKHFDSDGIHKYTLNWTYDPHGNVIKENNPLGDTIERQFNENNDLIFESNLCKNFSRKLSYDFMGRLIKIEEKHSDKQVYTTSNKYDVKGQLIAVTDHFGLTTHHEYDALGRLTVTKHPEYTNHLGKQTLTTQYSYDAFDNIISYTDENGSVIKKSYNIYKKPLQIIYPDGTVEKFSYNEDGSLETFTARNGLKSRHKHDCFGRLLTNELYSVEGTFISKTSATYNSFQKTSETDAEGRITYYKYDGAGRLIAVEKGDSLTEHTYDSWGRVATTKKLITCGTFLLKRFIYDKLNRVIEEKEEDQEGAELSYIQYAYDVEGNCTQVITSNGFVHTEYNSMKMPTLVVDALGYETRHLYNFKALNSQGQAVLEHTEIDPLGNQIIIQMNILSKPALVIRKNAMGQVLAKKELFYDRIGNLIRTLEHVIFQKETVDQIVTEWKYNKASQLLSLTEAVGTSEQKHTGHQYNVYGQKVHTIKPDGTKITQIYDEKGRLKHFESNDGSFAYIYHYNANDEILRVDDQVQKLVNTRAYDHNGYLINETLGNGYQIIYSYDAIGRPLTVSLPDHSSIVYEYRANYLKKVERLSAENKIKYTHNYTSYDASKNLLEANTVAAGIIQYTYNERSQLTQIASKHYDETIQYNEKGSVIKMDSTFCSQTYAYDDLTQLKSESGDFNHLYEYDSLYNCRFKDGLSQKVNCLNQVLDTSIGQYTYDANGNRISHNSDRFVYDALDRLVEVRHEDKTYIYTYDSFNRRISKAVADQKTHYIYFGQNEVGSFDESGLHEFRILGVGKGAEIGATIAIELNNTIYTPISDHNGNIVAILDCVGALVEKYRYTAFGEEEKMSAMGNPWRFSSKRIDEETGFVYYGRRYYDPQSAQWLTSDPLGIEAGPNLYAFLLNSPIDHIDLYGLASVSNAMGGLHHIMRDDYYPGYATRDNFSQKVFQNLITMPGQIIEAVGNHMVPIPVVREVLTFIGSFLQGRLESWQPSWRRDHSKSLGSIGRGEASPYHRDVIQNGINTTRQELEERAQFMSNLYGGQNIHMIYNGTLGISTDLVECIFHKISIVTHVTKETVKALKKHLKDVGPNGTINYYPHSEAGLIADLTLRELTSAERRQITVYSFGTAKIINLKDLGGCKNFISIRDPIPFISDPLGCIAAGIQRRDHVKFLAPSNRPEWDHSWNSDVYFHQLEILARQHLEKWDVIK